MVHTQQHGHPSDACIRQHNAFVQQQQQAQAQGGGQAAGGNTKGSFRPMPLTIPPLDMNTYSNSNSYQQQLQQQQSQQQQQTSNQNAGNPYLSRPGAHHGYGQQPDAHGHANGGSGQALGDIGFDMAGDGAAVSGIPANAADMYPRGASNPSAASGHPHHHQETSNGNDEKLVAQAVARALMELNVMNSAEHVKIAQTVAMRVFEVFKNKIRALSNRIGHLQQMLQQDTRVGSPSMQYQQLLNQQRHAVPGGLQSASPLPYGMGFQSPMTSPSGVMGPGGTPIKAGGASSNSRKRQSPAGRTGQTKKMKAQTHPELGNLFDPSLRNSAQRASAKSQKNRKASVAAAKKKADDAETPSNRWTDEQDEALQNAVKVYGGRNWKAISAMVPGRDHVQCLQRWKKVLQPGLVKGHWTPEEDAKLLQLIQDEKMHSWAMVADLIEGRTAKQCRERWSLNLDPSINRSPWTPEEDALLMKLHAKIGGKWAEIKGQFDGRTENSVKTRYKSLMRAKAREWTPEQDQQLIQLRMKHGRNWAAIAKELKGRSRNAIKVRCKTLEYDHDPSGTEGRAAGGNQAMYLGDQSNSSQAALTA